MNSHHQSDHSLCHQLQMDKTQLWEFMRKTKMKNEKKKKPDITLNYFSFAFTVFFLLLQILSKIPGGMLDLVVVGYVVLCSVEKKKIFSTLHANSDISIEHNNDDSLYPCSPNYFFYLISP